MKNKIIISSILTIAMCFSLIAGSTFALFTSNSEVNVAVSSAKVSVTATASAPVMGSTLGDHLGSANADGNSLSLQNFVPGDYATFKISVVNDSTVKVKYRTVITGEGALFSGLVVTIGDEQFNGKATSSWEVITPEQGDATVEIKVALPESAGNFYQGKNCTLTYTVEAVQANVDVVDDVQDLDATLTSGGNASIIKDTTINANDTTNNGYGASGLVVSNGAVFNGNGNTLTVTNANGTYGAAIYPTNGTIKNVTINGAFRGIFMGGASGDVYIDNVVIDKVCYTFNSDAGNKNYGVYISNSTLNGWTSYVNSHKEVVFTNCTFGKGTGGYDYAFCRPYNNSVFENCVFEEGYEFDTTRASEIVFINCYYGDTLITADNATTLADDNGNLFFYAGIGAVVFPEYVSTVDELTTAFANGAKSVVLENDIDATVGVTIPEGATLDGNGHTLTYTGTDYTYHLVKLSTGATVKNVTLHNYRVRTESTTSGTVTMTNVTINMDNDETGLDISRGAGKAVLTNVVCASIIDEAHLDPNTQVQVDYTPYGDVLLGTKWALEATDCTFGSLHGWNTTNGSNVWLNNTTYTVFRMHYWSGRTLYVNGVETAWAESGAIPVAHDVGGCWSVMASFR